MESFCLSLQPDLNLSVQAVIRGRNILHRYVHVEVPAALLDNCKRTFGVERASQGFFLGVISKPFKSTCRPLDSMRGLRVFFSDCLF